MIRLNEIFYSGQQLPPWGNAEVIQSIVDTDTKVADEELFIVLKETFFQNGHTYQYISESAKAYSQSTLGNYQAAHIHYGSFEKLSYATFFKKVKAICDGFFYGTHTVHHERGLIFIDIFLHLLKMVVAPDATVYLLKGNAVPAVMPDGTGFYREFNYFFITGSRVASDLKEYQTIATIKLEKE